MSAWFFNRSPALAANAKMYERKWTAWIEKKIRDEITFPTVSSPIGSLI